MANGNDGCMTRKPWELPFLAEPEEVAALRRVVRLHLQLWGLSDVADVAEICVSELVANVIRHVGAGTPSTLVVEMNGTRLRVALRDPETRALPTLLSAGPDDESGRGLAMLDVVSEQWGVILGAESKLVWCDLATPLVSAGGHIDDPRVAKSEACLTLYVGARESEHPGAGRVGVAVREEAAIDLIADLLHWLRAHGHDPDEALDRAQTHFEAELGAGG
ncbi:MULTISPECIES: ATP-binding protein [unclassified Streptomyces]|uniref:ATP-binding protein n=1 Tax=unclassified Streptomyces TaxID=2593676 RepID=UPI0038688CAD